MNVTHAMQVARLSYDNMQTQIPRVVGCLLEQNSCKIAFHAKIENAALCCASLKSADGPVVRAHSSNRNVIAVCIADMQGHNHRLFVRCFSRKCERHWTEVDIDDYTTMCQMRV